MTAVNEALLAASAAPGTPVDALPSISMSSSSSTSSLIPGTSAATAAAAVAAANANAGANAVASGATAVGRVSAGPATGSKGTVPPAGSGHHHPGGKAVLRQHGGPGSSLSAKNLSSNKGQPDEPLPDPTTCEVKPGKETTIEVNKDKLGLGLSIVGGSDTLLVRRSPRLLEKSLDI